MGLKPFDGAPGPAGGTGYMGQWARSWGQPCHSEKWWHFPGLTPARHPILSRGLACAHEGTQTASCFSGTSPAADLPGA